MRVARFNFKFFCLMTQSNVSAPFSHLWENAALAKQGRMRGAAETASCAAFRHGDFADEPVARLIGQELQRLIAMRHLLAQIARQLVGRFAPRDR